MRGDVQAVSVVPAWNTDKTLSIANPTCILVVCYIDMQETPSRPVNARNRPSLREDTSAPITVEVGEVLEHNRAVNRAVMNTCQILGRRVRIRIQPEVWTKWNGKWSYRRVRQSGVTVSCPNPDQAELVTEAISRVLKGMDGKFLVRCGS
jgi:hypothetical protein